MLLGALEARGTKMICSTGDAQGRIFTRVSIPTAAPEETMEKIIAFFREARVDALGVASFGPLDLREGSPTYGYITSTPKPGWGNYPLLPALEGALGVPAAFDTDVNAAALGEATLGAAAGLSSCVYVTVGTGVGAGIFAEGRLVHGLVHPEFGHFTLRAHPDDPSPRGFCPYHEGCVEGLASGFSMENRWGQKAHLLPEGHPAWEIEAYYLAQMCQAAVVILSPEKIILGGGVMQQAHLFAAVREKARALLGGYVRHPAILEGMADYIVPPGLGVHSGVTGALLLAERALR